MVAAVLSDTTVKKPSRLLAEALRDRMEESPLLYLGGPEAGTLDIARAYLPVFQLVDSTMTVVSVVPLDQAGDINTRSGIRTRRTVTVLLSVQRLIPYNPQSTEGKDVLDELGDYSERVLRACLDSVTDADGNGYAPTAFDSTGHDQEILKEWNQFAEVHSIAYETLI